MSLVTITLWFGIAAIYLGFAGTFGLLIRRLQQRSKPEDRWLAVLHGALILLPATVLVLGFQAWSILFSLLIVLIGFAIAWLTTTQPAWSPIEWWRPKFGHRYFAVSMALAASWALALSWQRVSLAPAILAAAALAAALASISKTPQDA